MHGLTSKCPSVPWTIRGQWFGPGTQLIWQFSVVLCMQRRGGCTGHFMHCFNMMHVSVLGRRKGQWAWDGNFSSFGISPATCLRGQDACTEGFMHFVNALHVPLLGTKRGQWDWEGNFSSLGISPQQHARKGRVVVQEAVVQRASPTTIQGTTAGTILQHIFKQARIAHLRKPPAGSTNAPSTSCFNQLPDSFSRRETLPMSFM